MNLRDADRPGSDPNSLPPNMMNTCGVYKRNFWTGAWDWELRKTPLNLAPRSIQPPIPTGPDDE
jgi:hypothetical protein